MRYEDLPSNRGGGGSRHRKPGYDMPTNLSTVEMHKIDADYLEKQFRIVTLRDVSAKEDQLMRQTEAIEAIKKNLGVLPERKQKYALQVLYDVKNGVLLVEEGKTFMFYIEEYETRATRQAILLFSEQIGINADLFYELYCESSNGQIDTIKLAQIEQSVNLEKATRFLNAQSPFQTKAMLHSELMRYLRDRGAESEQQQQQ